MAEQFRSIVRVLNTDIDGNKKVFMALKRIRGIGFMFSNAICNNLSIERDRKIGTLTVEDVKKIEELVENPVSLPKWLLNRRRDYDTGSLLKKKYVD